MKKHYTLFAGIVLTFSALISFAQWQPTAGPLGAGRTSSMAAKDSNIFAGTFTGGVFVSSDSGLTWTAQNNGLTNTNNVIAMAVSGANVFAGLNSSLSDTFAVFLSANNGASWAPTNLMYNYLWSLAVKPGYVLAGTWYGVSYTVNNGASWNSSVTGLPGNASVSSFAFAGTKIFCGVFSSSTGGTGVFASTNNMMSWGGFNTGLGSSTIVNALAVIGPDVFAGTTSGAYKSVTTTSNWSAANTGLPGGNVRTFFVMGTDLYAGTDNGIFLSTNSAGSWLDISSGLPALSKIYSITTDSMYLYVGTDSLVWRRPLSEIITGTEENEIHQTNVLVYPNPFASELTVSVNSNQQAEIILYDSSLRKLLQQRFVHSVSIDTGQLSEGIYFYEVRNKNNASWYGKLVKL